MNGAGSDQASDVGERHGEPRDRDPVVVSATRCGRPAQNTAHSLVDERVAPGGVLEHRGAAERQHELDVVVPVRARHRGHEPRARTRGRTPRAAASRRRPAREDPGRISPHEGSMPGSSPLASCCMTDHRAPTAPDPVRDRWLLTPEQVEQFDRDGYLLLKQRIDARPAAPAAGASERWIGRRRRGREDAGHGDWLFAEPSVRQGPVARRLHPRQGRARLARAARLAGRPRHRREPRRPGLRADVRVDRGEEGRRRRTRAVAPGRRARAAPPAVQRRRLPRPTRAREPVRCT